MSFYDAIRIGASGAADYEVERSLRFNTTDQTEVTNSSLGTSPTSRRISTVSVWTKRSDLSSGLITYGYSGGGGSQSNAGLRFVNSNTNLGIENAVNNSQAWQLVTTRVFRDFSAWYHIVVAIDTTQSTASDRVKVYINGVQETSFSTANYPSQNYDNLWLYSNARIGASDDNGSYYAGWNGYIAEYNAIDGQALTPASFGETDATTGQWMPKKYTGSYGTNGHYLNFSDNSGTTATTLGKDYSGNGKNFTPSNFSVAAGDGNDSKTDTPTLNKATLNPLTGFTYNATLSEGNLKMSGSSGFKEISTIAFAGTSKFYYEVVNTSRNGWQLVGIFVGQPNNPSNGLTNTAVWGFASTQATYFGGSYTSTSDVPSWTNNDVMGIKYENGSLKLYKNGTLQTATTSSVPTGDIVFAYIVNDNQSAAAFARFSSNDWTQDSAAGVDATWELSSANLPDPTIALPTDHFDTLLYTGNTGSQNITGLDFDPDWVWAKSRSTTGYHHEFYDTLRGDNLRIFSSQNNNELTGYLQFGQTGGFSLTAGGGINISGQNLVAWCWNAGGSTVTNNNGTISTQVRANTTAGFSVVTYTGNGSTSATIGHGLGVSPDLIYIKNRSSSVDWVVMHSSNPSYDGGNYKHQPLKLNTNDALVSILGIFSTPNSSTQSISDGQTSSGNRPLTNTSGSNYVAYFFSSVAGYSKAGSYTGNGSTDGTFVYTGFRPAYIILKRTNSAAAWIVHDNKRAGYNGDNDYLQPDDSTADSDGSSGTLDILSNGFKLKMTAGTHNGSGDTYIYFAIAESTYKYARAR